MAEAVPLTFLCITTYEKGQEFMRECKRQGKENKKEEVKGQGKERKKEIQSNKKEKKDK